MEWWEFKRDDELEWDETPTLRDQFAMAALNWDRLDFLLPGGGERDAAEVASAAYRLADAMLEARKK